MKRLWFYVASVLTAGSCFTLPAGQAVTGPTESIVVSAQPVARSDPWWLTRHAERLALARGPRAKVVFIGDSITQGWEGAGRSVWEKRFAPLPAVNLGFSGDRTQHVLWRIGAGRELGGSDPRVVVLMIGTNNSVVDSADDIAVGIEAIVKLLCQQHPRSKVLLLAVFPRGQTPSDAQRLKLLVVNQKIRQLSDGGRVIFRNIGDKFLNQDGTLSPAVMPDYLHLSELGYSIWADAIEGVLMEMLREP